MVKKDSRFFEKNQFLFPKHLVDKFAIYINQHVEINNT